MIPFIKNKFLSPFYQKQTSINVNPFEAKDDQRMRLSALFNIIFENLNFEHQH